MDEMTQAATKTHFCPALLAASFLVAESRFVLEDFFFTLFCFVLSSRTFGVALSLPIPGKIAPSALPCEFAMIGVSVTSPTSG